MEKSSKHRRRSHLIVAAILMVALLGLLVINTDRVSAERSADPVSQEATTGGVSAGNTAFFSSAMPSLVKLLSALAVVILCIYVGVFLLKKLMGRKYTGGGRSDALEVIESSYVGPKKTVTLLRVGERAVLVGVAENQMSMLTELSRDETAKILEQSRSEEEQPMNFKSILSTASDKLREIGLKREKKAALEA
ncbi:MAG: flagellar biosynthetic protein FliO [candidate division Zixibacteria bacterium]|nr:flagellar biosynthetic protein FliO [candidate division Zixibacteria bacterium]